VKRSDKQLNKLQRQAAQRTAAAFRRAAALVAKERELRQEAGGAPTDLKYVETFPEVATLKFVDPRSEVVSRAFDLLKPIDLPESHFREQLALMMSEVRIAHLDNRLPALGPTKKQIEKVRQALKRLKQAITAVPPHARVAQSIYWNDFCRLLDEVTNTVEHHYSNIQVGKGGPLPDSAKHEAAKLAFELLIWKNELPAKTNNGTFYELSSTLYEGGTGIAGADLQRVCRFAIDSLRASGRAEKAPGDAAQKGVPRECG
jgi:hypothetical protein